MKRKNMHRRHPSVSAKQVGLARYRKEDWNRWLETVDDREMWQDTYEAWQRDAVAMAERLRRAGLEVIWVDLSPDEFSEWCRSRGYKNDAEARSRFAAEAIGNVPSQSRPESSSRPPSS